MKKYLLIGLLFINYNIFCQCIKTDREEAGLDNMGEDIPGSGQCSFEGFWQWTYDEDDIDTEVDFVRLSGGGVSEEFSPDEEEGNIFFEADCFEEHSLVIMAIDLNGDTCFIDSISLAPPPLPVTLKSFEAELNRGAIKLEWETSHEENVSRFEIYKYKEKQWIENGVVYANNYPSLYEHVDNEILGENYYQLKMIDEDGSYEYSSIVIVETVNKSKEFHYSFDTRLFKAQKRLRITNIATGMVYYMDKGENDLSELPNGSYVVENNIGKFIKI